jgi:hypothetical protein
MLSRNVKKIQNNKHTLQWERRFKKNSKKKKKNHLKKNHLKKKKKKIIIVLTPQMMPKPNNNMCDCAHLILAHFFDNMHVNFSGAALLNSAARKFGALLLLFVERRLAHNGAHHALVCLEQV